MDWLQMFVIRWLPADYITRLGYAYDISSNMENSPSPLWPVAITTLPKVLAFYDILCCLAIEIYTSRRAENIKRDEYLAIDDTLSAARSYIKSTTIEHDGCDTGKREFLEGTGLWDEDEVAEMFSREHNIYIDVSMRVCLTREIPGGHDADDWANDEISESDVDQAVRDFVQYDSVDWSINDIEPA
jgi:hypothetical protein